MTMASLDVIAAIDITATAAVLVGTIAAAYPGPLPARLRIVGAFVLWFTLVVLASGFDLLDPVKGFGMPALAFAFLIPMVAIAFAATSTAERWQRVLAIPMAALILTHVLRVLGVEFLMLWSAGRLTAPFAPSAGWGDIITGVAAVPVAWAVWRQAAGWRALAIIWNLFGAADLIAAVAFGIASAPGSPLLMFPPPSEPIMTTLPWVLIPAYLVPIWLLTHALMLVELARHASPVDLRAQRL
jgi:putative effector of murein hydrolase LrgA (UPF0299 family)